MFTKEPSRDVTPLSNEPGGFREPAGDILPPPPPAAVAPPQPWFEVVKAFLVWAGSFILLLFTPVVLAVPYFIYSWAKHGVPRPEAIIQDRMLILLSIIGTILAHLLTLILIWFYATGGGKRPFGKSVGFEWPKTIPTGMGTLLCCALAIVLLGIGWAITQFVGGEKTQLDLIVESSMAARYATALAAVATAPLVEELIYRGVLYSALERAAGIGVAVAVVSLLFAGIHVFQYINNIGVILVITLLSFTLTVVRAYSRSVIPPFLIHLVFNGIQSLVLVLAPFLDKSILNKEEITPTTPGFEIALHLLEKISVYLCRMT